MVQNQNKSVPELRFKGFSDAWVQRKLGDVVSISAGGDVDKTKLTEDGEYPVLANALTNSGIVGYYESYKVEAPAVTVTGRGDVGHAVARHVNFTPVVRLLSLKSDVLDADFLASMLNQTNILVESTGVPQLTAPQLGSYKISYPNLDEQTKIGQLMNAFDNLIAANQRKVHNLKQLKKSYLERIFNQTMRFTGFTEPWVQRNLASLGNVFTGNTPKTSDNENWTSDTTGHVWITPTDIQQLHTSDSDRHLSDFGWERARVVPEKSVLITSIASIGKNTINTVPAAFNQQINAIVPDNTDAEFILAAMEKESGRFASLAGQTATAIINKTEFEKFEISAPSLEEQTRIGDLFSKIDNLIAANQCKVALFQKQKTSYLQSMFI